MSFATYLHLQSFNLSKPLEDITFGRYSLPYYRQVCQALAQSCSQYQSLPLRKAQLTDYASVHSQAYLKKLILKALDRPLDQTSLSLPAIGSDCQGLEYAIPGYLYGLGGMLEAIDRMKQGILQRAYCFSMVGHHAHREWGHGYCLLNPLAAAVRYAQLNGFAKVVVIDWDIHHGDGTQEIFSHDSSVYCISIHSTVDIYMAKASGLQWGTTEQADRVGHCNIPVIPKNFPRAALAEDGLGGEFYEGQSSIEVFRDKLNHLPWKPDLIAIFSGYDAHRKDCGEDTTDWTNEDFVQLTKITLKAAHRFHCPVLSCHGGGYRLPITVSAASDHLKTLAEFLM